MTTIHDGTFWGLFLSSYTLTPQCPAIPLQLSAKLNKQAKRAHRHYQDAFNESSRTDMEDALPLKAGIQHERR